MRTIITPTLAFLLACTASTQAQQIQTGTPVTTVPRLIRISNSFHPANGLPTAPMESVTLSVYGAEHDGAPVWQETQNIPVDAEGRYTVLMGATRDEGMPLDLFTSTEPRWLGVQFNRAGEVEQPRAQLVSVPYALKASDAETLGGRPASAYLLAPDAVVSGDATRASNSGSSSATASLPNPKSLKPRSITGSMNYIPYFTDSTNDLGNSVLYQSGGNIGIGTTTPAFPLTIGGTYHALGNAVAIPNAASYASFDSAGSARSLFWMDNSNPDIIHIRNNQRGAGGIISLESRVGGTPSLTILNSGYVGIGTTAPAYPLSIGGIYSSLGNAIAIPNNSSFAGFDSAGSPRSFFWMDSSNPDILHVRNNQRGVGGTISLESQAGGAPSLAILSDGNVGIGTTTPASALEVAGNLTVSGSGHALIFPDGTQQSTAGPAGIFGSNSINFFTEGGSGTTCTLGSILLNASTLYTGNYLPADGRLLSIQSNTALFSLLGTNYGGNGFSNFALPDLRKAAPNNTQYLICVSGVFP